MTKGLVNLKRILFSLLVVMPSSGVHAQATYPTRAVHFITPFPPGGSLDPMTRMAAQKLGERWGQPTVVENRPGANTIIGTQAVARAAPDGYTLCLTQSAVIVGNPLLHSKLPYDPERQFLPIIGMGVFTSALLVHPSVPAKTMRELAQLAQQRGSGAAHFAASNGTCAMRSASSELAISIRRGSAEDQSSSA